MTVNPYAELILRTPSERESIICLDLQNNEVFYLKKSMYSSSEYLVKPRRDLSNVKCLYVSNISIVTKPLDVLPQVKQIVSRYVSEHLSKQVEELVSGISDETVKELVRNLCFIYVTEVTYTYCLANLELKREREDYQVVKVSVDLDSKVEVKAYRIEVQEHASCTRRHCDYYLRFVCNEKDEQHFVCGDCWDLMGKFLEKMQFIFDNVARQLGNAVAYREVEHVAKRTYNEYVRLKIVPEESTAKLAQFLAIEAKAETKVQTQVQESRIEALKHELTVPVTVNIPGDVYEKVLEVVPEDELKTVLQEAIIDFLKQLFFYETDHPPVLKPEKAELIKVAKFRRENGNVCVNVVNLPSNLDDPKVFAEVYVNGELIYAREFDVRVCRNRKYINVVIPKRAIRVSPIEIEVKVYRLPRPVRK